MSIKTSETISFVRMSVYSIYMIEWPKITYLFSVRWIANNKLNQKWFSAVEVYENGYVRVTVFETQTHEMTR